MTALIVGTLVEGALILALSWGAVYTLHASAVFSGYIVPGLNYFYPLSINQVFALLVVLVCLLGVFLVFALGTKGIKWFVIPILALCVPTLIAHSGLPTYLEQEYGISLNIPILNSSLTLTGMLVMALALVTGFVVLHQMITIREMGDHLVQRGVDAGDIAGVYKGRGISIIVIVLLSVAASYVVSHYSSRMKGIFSQSLNLSPLIYLVVGIGAGLVAIAVILMLLITQRPEMQTAAAEQSKPFRHKAAVEAGAVLHMFVPRAITGKLARVWVKLCVRLQRRW